MSRDDLEEEACEFTEEEKASLIALVDGREVVGRLVDNPTRSPTSSSSGLAEGLRPLTAFLVLSLLSPPDPASSD
jgi:hypothetical protein